jgi:hypothetical protein
VPTTPAGPTFGPITGLSIATSASGTTVYFTVSVDPNGKSATVHIVTNMQTQTFTTGTGAWSWSGSDNIGYSATDTINVTVSDPGRTTVTGQASRSTGAAPPPPPSVTLAKGPAAPSGFWYAITLQHFAANADIGVTCHDSVDPGGFISFNLHTDGSGNAFTQTRCYSGDHPDHWAKANGVESNHVGW